NNAGQNNYEDNYFALQRSPPAPSCAKTYARTSGIRGNDDGAFHRRGFAAHQDFPRRRRWRQPVRPHMDRLSELENTVLRLQRQIAALQNTTTSPASTTTPVSSNNLGAVNNFLRNGDLSFSENHYNDPAPPSGANDEKEAA